MSIKNLLRKEVNLLEPYNATQSNDKIKKNYGLTEIINLSTNEGVLGPSEVVKEALVRELSQIHRYPDSSSFLLREDLARYYGVHPDMIITTNGGDELIYLLASSFVSPGDEVIMGEVGFKSYESATTLFGGKIVAVPLKDQHLDLSAIARRVNQNTKMIFLCNPYNPSGTIFAHRDFIQFLQDIPLHPMIVLDEAYSDFVKNREFPKSIPLIREEKHAIVILRTFSKIGGMAGLRMGFGLAKGELIGYLKKVQPPYSVNRMAQIAARAFLTDQNYRERVLENNRRGKIFLYRELERIKLSYIPTEANFIFIDAAVDSDLVYEQLMSKGIMVRSGKIWGFDTSIRVTIGTEEQNRKLIAALEAITKK